MSEQELLQNTNPPSEPAEKNGPSVLERTLQILSITFFLTYISGYLVTSTFLNSYGIPADASEFLKARYLYVGFLYLLFIAVVGMAFGFFAVFYDHARANWIRKPVVPLASTPSELKDRYFAVWCAIGFVFASSEAAQIMTLNLRNFRDYVLLQTGLLAAFLFYQLTNARALHHPGWDRDRSIFKLRARTALAILIFAALPFLFHYVPKTSQWIPEFLEHHHRWAIVILNTLLLFSVFLAVPFFYTGSSLKARLDHEKLKWWRGIGYGRTFFAALVLSPANLIVLATYKSRWIWLPRFNLIFTAAALASIIFMSVAYTRDRKERNEPLNNSQRWSAWLLRIATGGTLYVISAIGYANVVYPLVPFAKSGGDFMTASVVRVHFQYGEILNPNEQVSVENGPTRTVQPDTPGSRKPAFKTRNTKAPSAKDQVTSKGQSNPDADSKTQGSICEPGVSITCDDLVILEESPDVVYFARIHDAVSLTNGSQMQDGAQGTCGPRLWTSGISDPKGPYRPHLIAVNRRNIVSIEEVKAVSESESCR